MKRSEELFEKIERYLEGRLSKDELNAFEREISTDEGLKKEIELHRNLHTGLQDQDTVKFRKKLNELSSKSKKKTGFRLPNWLKVAAVLIFAAVGIWVTRDTEGSNELYDKYYMQYPAEDVLRGEGTENEKTKILQTYTNGNFKEVISKLEALSSKTPGDLSLKMYLGNCYLNTNQTEEAIAVFESLLGNTKYGEDALWYLALAHLKAQNRDRCAALLQEVSAANGILKDKADQLLEELRINTAH